MSDGIQLTNVERPVVERPVATRPLTARSVVLSLLLGAPGGALPVRDLVALAERCGVAASTARVALSRLVAAGDLGADAGTYRLGAHHRERQRRQEAALAPRTVPWDGTWTVVVVTRSGRDAAARAALRRTLAAHRYAGLREGVWTRPDTLAGRPDLPAEADPVVLSARPDDPAGLATRLWDLPGWRRTANGLLAAGQGADLPGRLAVNAAIVRHLRDDPWLPEELLPADWPAAALRRTYEEFRAELATLHETRPEDRP